MKIAMSNECYSGYQLSLAQAELLKGTSAENKEKVCRITKSNIENHEGENRLRQDLFDNQCEVDNYLFAALAHQPFITKEKEIMFEFYCSLERVTDDVLNSEYLNLYPGFKKKVINQLKYLESL